MIKCTKGIVLITFSLFAIQSYCQQLPNTISLKDRLYTLSTLWMEVKYNFVNIDTLKCNIDSTYKALIGETINSDNDYTYYAILKKFIAQLNDGHSEVYDNGQFQQYCDYPPIKLINLNKRVFVSLAAKQLVEKIPLGSEIIEIENQSVDKYLKNYCFPYVSASNENSRWSIGVQRIH